MKYEIKIEIDREEDLIKLINDSYFNGDSLGKLSKIDSSIEIKKEDPLFIIFRGLNNMTSKITNVNRIDGSLRCVIQESDDSIKLYPVNVYCVMENERYSFY